MNNQAATANQWQDNRKIATAVGLLRTAAIERAEVVETGYDYIPTN